MVILKTDLKIISRVTFTSWKGEAVTFEQKKTGYCPDGQQKDMEGEALKECLRPHHRVEKSGKAA